MPEHAPTTLAEAVDRICDVENEFMDEVRKKVAWYSREFHLPRLHFVALLEALKLELFNIYNKEAMSEPDEEAPDA